MVVVPLSGKCVGSNDCDRPIDSKVRQLCKYHVNKDYQERNKDAIKEARKEYYKANKESFNKWGRDYAAKNRNNPVTQEHITDNVKKRFFDKVNKTDNCWIWTGARTAYRPKRKFAPATLGYGTITVNGRPFYAHRLSWLMHNGPLIPGLVIDHLCENTLCVNPEHMQQVTSDENAKRSSRHTINGAKYVSGYCKNGHKRTPEMKGKACFECYPKKNRHDGYCKRGHWRGPERHGKPCLECLRLKYKQKKELGLK